MKNLFGSHILNRLAHVNSAKIRREFTSEAIGFPDFDSFRLPRTLSIHVRYMNSKKVSSK